MSALSVMKERFDWYKQWVIMNPTLIAEMETLTKWTSFLVAGKINKSPIVSELVYSLSNLFVLYNDTLIIDSRPENRQNKRKASLKYWMTVLHFTEVFIEMTARNRWGVRGKWSAATILQLIKCMANFILIYRYKETPVQHPPMPALHRKKFSESNVHEDSKGFKLKRSGRIVRRVENSPFTQLRDWKPLNADNFVQEDTGANVTIQRLAETLYVLKPLLHLTSVASFGTQSWKQWLFSLLIDLTSFKLYNDELKTLNYEQRVEISRRKLCLLYYLLRSPMYNKHSKSIINKFLICTAKNVPFAGLICNPILQYISIWQDTYFYMWSN